MEFKISVKQPFRQSVGYRIDGVHWIRFRGIWFRERGSQPLDEKGRCRVPSSVVRKTDIPSLFSCVYGTSVTGLTVCDFLNVEDPRVVLRVVEYDSNTRSSVVPSSCIQSFVSLLQSLKSFRSDPSYPRNLLHT